MPGYRLDSLIFVGNNTVFPAAIDVFISSSHPPSFVDSRGFFYRHCCPRLQLSACEKSITSKLQVISSVFFDLHRIFSALQVHVVPSCLTFCFRHSPLPVSLSLQLYDSPCLLSQSLWYLYILAITPAGQRFFFRFLVSALEWVADESGSNWLKIWIYCS